MPSRTHDQTILAHLNKSGSARILDLAASLRVTDETIRRAIVRLEAQGAVTRVHGGVQVRDWASEPGFALRYALHPAAKRAIATRTAALITDGASLFLDVGSTTAYVAQALRVRRELLVVTNSLSVAQALTGVNGTRVYMAGGELRAHDGGAFGAEALAFVRQFRVQHAILSVAAVDARSGFLLHDLREAEFSRAIIEASEEAIVVADATKFAATAPIRIAAADRFARLVTDAAPPQAIADSLTSQGVEVIVAHS
jgi:DeoR family transcriptional regulator, glycerol-3-phosphate regulon repressor